MRILITILQLLLCFSVYAQNTLLVYTKFPTHLNFVDGSNNSIPVTSIWNQADGGLVLNFQKLENTFVVADEMVNFKLSDQNRLTKLIALDTQNKISLHKCFTSEKYCCEKLTDKQKKGTEKLLAVSVMKKSVADHSPLIFAPENLTQIQDLTELEVNWATENSIKEIYLVDITDLETIWQSESFTSSVFKASDLHIGDVKLKKDHKYQLNIQLNTPNPEAGKFSYEFDYTNLAFESNHYHFPTKQAVSVDWRTKENVSKATLLSQTGEKLWESNLVKESNFSLSSLPTDVQGKVQAGQEYTIQVSTEKSSYEYQFMILLDPSESDDLKALLDF